MRQLLKITNYAAQLMALIDIGKTIKHWATKNDTTSDGQTKKVSKCGKGGLLYSDLMSPVLSGIR